MEKDIAPELLEAIRERLREKEGRDPQIAAFTEKLNARKATQRDVSQYSGRLGELLSETLREILTPDNLPEGKLYYNIAARTIGPMLREADKKINDAAIQAQKVIDEENGIGMKAVPAAFPEKRVNDLLYKIGSEETTPEQAQTLMGEPIENNCRKFFDEHVRHNANVRFKAGLSPMIVRTVGSSEIRTSKRRKYHVPCKWCISMAGEYPYDEVNDTGNDVFRRHSGCRCIVEYVCDGKKQNVWSKKMWQADKETLEKRAAYGLERQKKKPTNRKDDRKRQEFIAEYNRNREKAFANADNRGIINTDALSLSSHNLHNSSDVLYERVKHVPPIRGYDDVFLHGDAFGVSTRNADGSEVDIPVDEFIKTLKRLNLENSAIRLCSCSAGEKDRGLAYLVAREMNMPVMAATTDVWISKPDDQGISTMRLYRDNGKGRPDYSKPGIWRIFMPDGKIKEVIT